MSGHGWSPGRGGGSMVKARPQDPGASHADAGRRGQPARKDAATQARRASRTCFLLGSWLAISPWALGYSSAGQAVANALIVGSAIALLALIRSIRVPQLEWVSWVNFVLGLWLTVS